MVSKVKKSEIIDDLKVSFAESSTVCVARFSGLTIRETDELRKTSKQSGVGVRVAKNNLAKIASSETAHSNIVDLFSGQTLIAYSVDPVAAAKVLVDFSKKNEKVSVVGGSFGGTHLDENGVKELANTPSLDESRGRIVGLLTAPAGKIARVINTPAGNLARVFSAYAQSEGN